MLLGSTQAELSVSVPGPVWIGQQQYVGTPSPIHFRSEEPLEEAVSETKRNLEARANLYLVLKDAATGKTRELLPTPVEGRLVLERQLAEERRARAAEEARLGEALARLEEDRALARRTEPPRGGRGRKREAQARKHESEARKRESEARKHEAEARAQAAHAP